MAQIMYAFRVSDPNIFFNCFVGIVDRPLGILDTVVNTYLGSSKNTGVFSDIAPGLVDVCVKNNV